jgi:ElaB/YqjD/DUF883 family membrane-anchored ribosome-binding protein
MPSGQSELPEGTDHIIIGAMEMRTGETSAAPTPGFVGTAGSDGDTGGTAMTDDSVRGQIKQGVATIRGQAGGRIRELADDGKARASDALDEFSRIVEEAAESIEERLGGQYSPYAKKAAEAVSGLATTLRDRDVDQLYEDARGFVRKSPAIAIGVAAALGFVAVRLVKAGLADTQEETKSAAAPKRGGKRRPKASA